MAIIKITNLGGISPSLLARNLPDNGAQTADNLQAKTPEFRPFNTDLTVFSGLGTSNPQSLYRFARSADGSLITSASQGWRSHPNGIDVAKGQLNDDLTERTYYTFSDGSAPPRVFDNQGDDRQLGVPAPTTKPAVTAIDVYTFSPERKKIEKLMALQEAVRLSEANATPVLVGLGSSFAAPGWVLESTFSTAPDANRHVVRLFALDPTTNQIIDTYSAMPPSEAAWVFNPALGGDYATLPGGFTLPSWATGHTKWWRIRLRAFANAYSINTTTLATSLQTIKMPGTQPVTPPGTQPPYLTSTEATTLANDIALKFDKGVGRVFTLVNTLNGRQAEAAAAFKQGGAIGMKQAVVGFYGRADIAASIASATDTFAESIWRYFTVLGTADAPAFYQYEGDV